MSSISEKTFGSRLTNAETLSAHLKSFGGYAPPASELSAASLDTLLSNIRSQNTTVASSQAGYSAAVEARLQLFSKAPDALGKVLSPIGAAVRAKYGKEAKATQDMTELVNKLRGEGKAKPKITEEDQNSNEKSNSGVSQSERSYGSMTQHFADLIAMLTAMGANYAPTNNNIKLATLTTKLTAIRTANTAVAGAYGSLKVATDNRQTQYADLVGRVGRIKEAVKSQYGVKSSEYALVKGLKV